MSSTSEFHSRRRQTPRRSFQRKVGVLARGQYFVCQAGQIGEGGMSIITAQPLAVDTQLVVTFLIPGREFAIGRACVRNRQEIGPGVEAPVYGLQFIDVAFEIKRAIRSYVAAKSEEEAARDVL